MISFFRSVFGWENFEAGDFEVDTPDDSPLIDNEWLEGTEIANYIRRVAEKNKTIYVMEPEYFIHGESTPLLKRKIANVNKNPMKSMISATHIIWPVSRQAHWYLFIISKNKDDTEITIRCLDGFNTTKTHKILFENMKAFLQEAFAVKNYEYKFKSIKVREQNNGDDCGVVVCHYAEKFCQASNALSFDDACAEEVEVNPKQKSYLIERKRVREEESLAVEGQHVRKKLRGT